MRQDRQGGFYVEGLTQAQVCSVAHAAQCAADPFGYPVQDDPSVQALTSPDKPALQSDEGRDMSDDASQQALRGQQAG